MIKTLLLLIAVYIPQTLEESEVNQFRVNCMECHNQAPVVCPVFLPDSEYAEVIQLPEEQQPNPLQEMEDVFDSAEGIFPIFPRPKPDPPIVDPNFPPVPEPDNNKLFDGSLLRKLKEGFSFLFSSLITALAISTYAIPVFVYGMVFAFLAYSIALAVHASGALLFALDHFIISIRTLLTKKKIDR